MLLPVWRNARTGQIHKVQSLTFLTSIHRIFIHSVSTYMGKICAIFAQNRQHIVDEGVKSIYKTKPTWRHVAECHMEHRSGDRFTALT